MYRRLVDLEERSCPLRVAVVGAAGSMGRGIALQLGKTPGLRLVAAVDLDVDGAERAATSSGRTAVRVAGERDLSAAFADGQVVVSDDVFPILARGREAVDVLVESTNTIAFAARACESALRAGVHVVLMNAEVDCLLAPWLHQVARESSVVVTSDAGDQHGVLMRMIDEIGLWGFEIVMAGNIKGFLDRYATPVTIADEAAKRNLNPVMCAAYTDGTKLNIEMALVANGTGLVPARRGMIGPRASDVHEALDLFELEALRAPGVVDYILGAEPGGGVFVIGYAEGAVEQEYLAYYKLGRGPFYLFYRPYHLCHLETPWAIASAALDSMPLWSPLPRPVADVVAFAKTDLEPGAELWHGVGGQHVYGMIERADACEAEGAVPVCLLDTEGGERVARVKRRVRRDALVTWDDLEVSPSIALERWEAQRRLLAGAALWRTPDGRAGVEEPG